MPGHRRLLTQEEATRRLPFRQNRWDGGWVRDRPASTLEANEVAMLKEMVAFKSYLEGHTGSQKFTDTALPGSGTLHAWKFHPTTKKHVLHRGGAIWVADAAMTSWTQATRYAISQVTPTINGDTGSQLSLSLVFVSTLNSNNGTLYWNLTNSGTTRTLNIYKDLAKTQLVGRATRVGNGLCNILPQGNSGLQGTVTITYTGDDTDSGNTFVVTLDNGVADEDSRLRLSDKDMVLFIKAATYPLYGRMVLVSLSDTKFYSLNAFPPTGRLVDSGSQSPTTPYGYRILLTYCRIVDANGVADYTKNRLSGSLVHESGSSRPAPSPDNIAQDYGEFWVANPIASGTGLTLTLTGTGAVPGSSLLAVNADGSTEGHWTHLGVYRCLDMGSGGVDQNGNANNREVFIWDGDYPIGSETIQLTKTDNLLRQTIGKGYGLKSRFFEAMPSGEVGQLLGNWLYVTRRGDPRVHYCQLQEKRFAGQYQPAFQVLKTNDGVQELVATRNMLGILMSNSSAISSPQVFENVSDVEPVLVLRHIHHLEGSIGVVDWGSLAEMKDGAVIGHCSDHSIRIWEGAGWGEDLAEDRIASLLPQLRIGSAGGYKPGMYEIWYRTDGAQTYNNKCLRLGLGGKGGLGWSQLERNAWVYAPLYIGPVTLLDSNGVPRLLALDAPDSAFYWIEGFDGPDGLSLSKAWLDKIAVNGSGGTEITPSFDLKEWTGVSEREILEHQESHLFVRPVDEAQGYRAGFQVSVVVKKNGSTTALETVANVHKDGDIQTWKVVEARRIQLGYRFTTSRFRVVTAESRILSKDRAIIGAGPADTDEAATQKALQQTLRHWLSRYNPRLNRARGSLYTLTGTAPTLVTGPDGKDFALSFPSGASYSQLDTQTFTDFTISFWVKSVQHNARVYAHIGGIGLGVQFTSNTTLSISGAGIATIASIASGWHHFIIRRSGSTWSVYQNGAFVTDIAGITTAAGGTRFEVNPDGGTMQLFDIRLLSAVLSAADIAYYYADVINNAGGKVLP